MVLIISFVGNCFGQSFVKKQEPIEVLREFYTARSTLKCTMQDMDSLNILKENFCTKDFYKRIQDIENKSGIGPDILTKDYGIDSLGVKTLSVVKDFERENTYIVSYSVMDDVIPNLINNKVKVVIYVMVKNENGVFKIDNVE